MLSIVLPNGLENVFGFPFVHCTHFRLRLFVVYCIFACYKITLVQNNKKQTLSGKT